MAECYGTFIYPPVSVGKSLRKTLKGETDSDLRQRILIINFLLRDVVLSTTYKEHPLRVTPGGFLAVVCDSNKQAHDLLNEVILGLVFKGVSAHIVHLPEIAKVTLDIDKGTITKAAGSVVSPRTSQLVYIDSATATSLMPYRQQISTRGFKTALSTAEKLAKTIRYEWRSAFLAAVTHYENGEFTASFIMLWLTVEQHLHELWSQVINSLTNKRKRKFLAPSGYWSVDRSIELLNVMKCLPTREYNKLMGFKKKRNDIVHKMASAGKEDTKLLSEYVANMFRSLLA